MAYPIKPAPPAIQRAVRIFVGLIQGDRGAGLTASTGGKGVILCACWFVGTIWLAPFVQLGVSMISGVIVASIYSCITTSISV